jgi:hypothetical protein
VSSLSLRIYGSYGNVSASWSWFDFLCIFKPQMSLPLHAARQSSALGKAISLINFCYCEFSLSQCSSACWGLHSFYRRTLSISQLVSDHKPRSPPRAELKNKAASLKARYIRFHIPCTTCQQSSFKPNYIVSYQINLNLIESSIPSSSRLAFLRNRTL